MLNRFQLAAGTWNLVEGENATVETEMEGAKIKGSGGGGQDAVSKAAEVAEVSAPEVAVRV